MHVSFTLYAHSQYIPSPHELWLAGVLNNNIGAEITRGQVVEASLANSVVAEKDRATFQEQTIVAPEASRAVAVEKSLSLSLGAQVGSEASRAMGGEASLSQQLGMETSRGIAVEKSMSSFEGEGAVCARE